jgi:hypothetical protein
MDSNLKFRSNLEKGRKTMRKTTLILAATIAALLTLSTLSFGQEVTGNLVGTVKDSNGAGVPNATVKITNSGTTVVVRTAQTNEDGEFNAESPDRIRTGERRGFQLIPRDPCRRALRSMSGNGDTGFCARGR